MTNHSMQPKMRSLNAQNNTLTIAKSSAIDEVVSKNVCASTSCETCSLKGICLPSGLCDEDKSRIATFIKKPQVYRKNQHIYHQSHSFEAFYAVRSGAVKTYALTEEGEELITGFYLPGEVIGLDGLWADEYQNSAVALNSSSVCMVDFKQLMQMNQQIPELQHKILRLMSREINSDQQMLHVLSRKSAESRLAIFLLNYSERLKPLKLSANSFQLPMSRGDISSLLGMAIETVCREFTHLQKQGILEVSRKDIRIVNIDQLRKIAGQKNQANQAMVA